MKIRLADLTDLPAIYKIECENFSPEEAMSQELLARHIKLLPETFLVAEKDGQILGFLEGPVRPERYLLDISFTTSLSVSKEAQSMGVGRRLLEAMKEIAISNGRDGINLTCHDYLTAYYERHGFRNHGLSKSTYADEVWYDMVWEVPSKD